MIEYIYALCCPFTGDPKYVGKSNKPKSRLNFHMMEIITIKSTSKKKVWISELKEKGLRPRLVVLCSCMHGDSVYFEKFYFKALSESYELLNDRKFNTPSFA